MKKRFIQTNLRNIIMIIWIGLSLEVTGQKIVNENLEAMFYDYTVVSMDSRSIHAQSRNNHFFEVDIPKPKGKGFWKVELHDSGLISDDYVSQYIDEKGTLHKSGKTQAIPTKGHVVGDLRTTVSLTFNEGFIYGFIKDKSGYNFIEPLSDYDANQRGEDLYVVYNAADLKPTAPHTCGNTEMHQKTEELTPNNQENSSVRVGECFEVDYAIANDFLMFQDFGSVVGTENHAIGVTNNVQANYDDEFADELQYIIVTQFTSTSAAQDPWTSSANAGTLLTDFRSWGNSGGFGVTHDVGSLWTSRNFFTVDDDGNQNFGVIGLAYVGVICTFSRYNILENFTSNPQTKRVLLAHELGHNWSAFHDGGGSGFIMAPSVNTSTIWSNQSQNSINNHIATRNCLADCTGSSGPPSASFDFEVLADCTPGFVQFTNTSTGSGTLNYQWNFPGGIPSISTEENPLVTYNVAGSFNATLTVTNTSGSDTETQNGIVNINASPQPEFSYEIDGTQVSFFNISQNAFNYFWDFGDGTSSATSDPIHDYLDDGIYTVQLTATNICGDETIEEVIVIANPPTADFSATAQEGCAPLEVTFNSNASTNTDSYSWAFEGGNPIVSTEENPTVTYAEAGTYNVTMIVENETGKDTLELEDFITVIDVPVTDFSFEVEGNEVSFTNFSSGADTFTWDFGDGNTSMLENPTHTYENDGDYEVTLVATNECGDNEFSQTLTVSLSPVPSFEVVQMPTGCAAYTLDFESTSTNSPDSYEWAFEGGDPATSTEANPSVTYAEAGTFDVTLTVTNVSGSNTITETDFVTILEDPAAQFSFMENGLSVTFSDESNGAETYAWDFGDGNTSLEANPIHQYASEGIYEVALTVTNSCGSNTSTQIINNYTPVVADFTSDVASGCADLQVEFSSEASSNVTSWFWTFEGGTPATSTEPNPVVTYSQAGQYDVILEVSHPQSIDAVTLENYIAVNDDPIASFEYFDDLFEVDFTNTTVEGTTFLWDFGDGNTSNEANPTHTYEAEGTYEVTLTAANICGETSTTQSIMINALPTAAFNASSTTIGCGPLTVEFNDASSSNVTAWNWTFEGGDPATSTEENPTVVYTTEGIYSVQLEVTSAAGTDFVVIDDFVEVFGTPTAEIDFALEGNLINASNAGSETDIIFWEVDGQVFDEEEITYTFPENGIYEVVLIVENDCAADMASTTVEVDAYPEASIAALPLVVCEGEAVQIVDNSSNAENKMWILEGASPATSTEDSPTVVYDTEGSYSITLTVSNQYGTSTEEFTDAVEVVALPDASFTAEQSDNLIEFTSTITNATTILWDFGDGTTSTEENPSHRFETNGTFEVTLTVTNECGTFFVTETYTIISNSVSERDLAKVNIYPNPTQDVFNIELTNRERNRIKMDVLDINGRIVVSKSFDGSKYTLNVSDMSVGTYLIRLRSEQNVHYQKVAIFR